MTKLLNETIAGLLDRISEKYPDNDALVVPFQNVRYTYAEFRQKARQVAKGIMALGLKKGEHFAIWSTNCSEATLCQFAAGYAATPLVVINPAYRPFELEYVLHQSDSRLLIHIHKFKSSDYAAMLNEVVPELRESQPLKLKSKKLPKLASIVFIPSSTLKSEAGAITWNEMIERGRKISDAELDRRRDGLKPDEPVNIQYTSGTTGNPKGVLLTSYGLINNGLLIGERMNISPKDRLCIPVPFYHCFHLVLGNLAAVTHGSTMVIPAEHFDAEATLRTAVSEKCTVLHGVPTMFQEVLKLVKAGSYKKEDFRLRTGIMAGAPCPIDVMKDVIHYLGMNEVVIAYGLTEFSPVITMTRTTEPIEKRVSTVGTLLPYVEVKLVDDSGKEVGIGEPGEIIVRGPFTMKGYYNNPEATADSIRNGWLYTGDLGTVDSEGFYNIVGRKKEMIIRGGENIYPVEIEKFYRTTFNDRIDEIQVVGVPDERLGEVTCAVIIPKKAASLSEDDVKKHADGRISRYKIPTYVIFTDSLEEFKTVTGKFRKNQIQEYAVRKLGLEALTKRKTA